MQSGDTAVRNGQGDAYGWSGVGLRVWNMNLKFSREVSLAGRQERVEAEARTPHWEEVVEKEGHPVKRGFFL